MGNQRFLHELPLCPITNYLHKHEGHTNVHYVTSYSGSALRLYHTIQGSQATKVNGEKEHHRTLHSTPICDDIHWCDGKFYIFAS